MALTRKFLASKGLEADVIDEIIQAHTDTVEGLKEDRDSYKEDAQKLQKDLDAANAKIEDLSKTDTYKVKYDALKEEFETFKQQVQDEKTKGVKVEAFKSLLKEIGIPDKRIDSVTRVSDLDSIKLNKDGKIEGAEELKKSLKEEWDDFIIKDGGKKGAGTDNPPKNGGGKVLTREEIAKIADATERQAALKEYLLSQEE